MITLKGKITKVEDAEMQVSQAEVYRLAENYLSPIQLIKIAKKRWLKSIGISVESACDVKIHKTELSDGVSIYSWMVTGCYGEWIALERNDLTLEELKQWHCFEGALSVFIE